MHAEWIGLAGAIVALVIMAIVVHLSRGRRSLLQLRIEIEKTGAGVDALLKHRNDELPKLIGTCRGYMPHDHPALDSIARTRTDYLKARTLQEKAIANVAARDALKNLFKIAGEYPGLKSNNSFVKLRKQNAELEKNIEEQQELFNELANSYNRRIRRFPESLMARRAHLQPREPIPNPASEDEA